MLTETAQNEGISAKRLWLDPLDTRISLEELENNTGDIPPFSVLAGIIDDPEYQTRHTLFINLLKSKNILIAGESGSGKTTFLKTILFGVISHFAPDEICFYILDLSGRSLTAFNTAPHCGAVLHDESESDFERMLAMISDIIAERKKLFSDMGVADYESYLISSDGTSQKLPLILVVIDNISGLANFKKGSELLFGINQYLKEGLSYGVRYIITANHSADLNSKAKQEIATRFSLQLKDKYEYGDALNTRCSYTPPTIPGRGLCVYNDSPLEYHVAMLRPDDTVKSTSALIQSVGQQIANNCSAKVFAQKLPIVNEDQEYEQFCEDIPVGRIPLGYSIKDAKKISIPLKQASFLSIYFGNMDGKKKIFQNFLHAFQREHGKVLYLAPESGSVIEDSNGILENYPFDHKVIKCKEGAGKEIISEIVKFVEERKPIRNRFCEEHGIETSAISSLAVAENTIRAETEPIFILIESFLAFANCMKSEEIVMKTVFEIARYYNILFLAGYDPDDTSKLFANTLQNLFNPDRNILLFGGKMDKQTLVSLNFKETVKETLQKFGRGLMEYRGKTYTITMPCGSESKEETVEEASIF